MKKVFVKILLIAFVVTTLVPANSAFAEDPRIPIADAQNILSVPTSDISTRLRTEIVGEKLGYSSGIIGEVFKIADLKTKLSKTCLQFVDSVSSIDQLDS